MTLRIIGWYNKPAAPPPLDVVHCSLLSSVLICIMSKKTQSFGAAGCPRTRPCESKLDCAKPEVHYLLCPAAPECCS